MIHTIKEPLIFCDVETTGGNASFSRITEIAAIRYENGHEVARINTLVNPHTRIPFSIQMLTNITNVMTDAAPDFSDIAPAVADIFSGGTLVAHHSRFDYSFIKAEMDRAGFPFNPPQICTAKLSRRLYPKERSHGLSAIIERFNFTCSARHRALGDTEVLVDFAKRVEKDSSPDKIVAALSQKNSATLSPPPNVDPTTLTRLPENPGVYTFIGKNGEILYIGKSVNIRQRVLSHFSNANRDRKSRLLWSEIYDIETHETSADFSAQLLEIYKIKQENPVYNRRLRKNERLWALTRIEDAHDYHRFTLAVLPSKGVKDLSSIYGIFKTKSQAKSSLGKLAKEHALCPALLGLEPLKGACFSAQLGVCSGACKGDIAPEIYNVKIAQIFAARRLRTWPYVKPKEIILKHPKHERYEKFVIDNWILKEATVLEDQDSYAFFEDQTTFFDYDIYKVLAKVL